MELHENLRESQQQIERENTAPLMDDLETEGIFRVEDEEEGDSVTDLVMLVCQLLRRDLRELRELVDTIEPVESWDEG